MPKTIEGAEHWLFGRVVVEDDVTGGNLVDTEVTFFDVDTNAPLQARDAATDAPVTIVTNSRGETRSAYRLPRVQVLATAGSTEFVVETIELGALSAVVSQARDAAVSAAESAGEVAASVPLNLEARLTALQELTPVEVITGSAAMRIGVFSRSEPPSEDVRTAGDVVIWSS